MRRPKTAEFVSPEEWYRVNLGRARWHLYRNILGGFNGEEEFRYYGEITLRLDDATLARIKAAAEEVERVIREGTVIRVEPQKCPVLKLVTATQPAQPKRRSRRQGSAS